ncbi:hypothetical protein Tco_0821865 [Tanacetum coccineum]|uniref:Uncharacterized protein n=1 Tax=Tanacetum coccineum TaxID=301880 RepID=A0ABQ5ADF4_9ASTR
MSIMAENVIVAGAENRHPMIERSQYDLWQIHKILYIQGKEHGQQILDLVVNGPFQFETVEISATPNTPATTRVKTLDGLTPEEKIRQACDIKATNIIQNVKLAKDMHNASFDKLYIYVRQHEVHANEAPMMRQRFPDPLALCKMCKDDRLEVIRVILQRVKLLEHGLSRKREMLLQTNQRSFDVTTAKVEVILQSSVLNQRGHIIHNDKGERFNSGPHVQALTTITIFQTNDIDAFDLDCDEAPTASAIFMENLTYYDSNVLSDVPNYDTYQDNNV